ncbi:hypothetical protein ADK41_16715 [Streptomyces caelestis]|uniref:Uncharacterized protein n=1 Tax=Streptomyces caelestis TaxID=36816 RepID=A0A0M8QLD7_9ACTN|nr:hypothetical protein ADK41_16715 [Streptomyces caelestis]KOV21079.1 hypothetical protein ADK58_32865 [Streptomyces sp. XY152]
MLRGSFASLGDEARAGGPGWEAGPADEWGVAVLAPAGRRSRPRREAVEMRVAECATASRPR